MLCIKDKEMNKDLKKDIELAIMGLSILKTADKSDPDKISEILYSVNNCFNNIKNETGFEDAESERQRKRDDTRREMIKSIRNLEEKLASKELSDEELLIKTHNYLTDIQDYFQQLGIVNVQLLAHQVIRVEIKPFIEEKREENIKNKGFDIQDMRLVYNDKNKELIKTLIYEKYKVNDVMDLSFSICSFSKKEKPEIHKIKFSIIKNPIRLNRF
jgi:hypothetical protein